MSKPDKILAAKILDKISESKIIPDDFFTRYKNKIAQGMTSEDWIILSEPKDVGQGDQNA